MTAPAAVATSVAQVQVRMATIHARIHGTAPDKTTTSGTSTAASVTFERLMGSSLSGSLGSTSLTSAGLTSAVQEYVGIPYVWGGTDPATGLDCSGFTQHLMRRFGVELPRVSADQMKTGTAVADLAAARPGDLIGWDNGPRNVGADHVAVYLGNGRMAEAPGTGGRVQIVAVDKAPDYIRRVVPDAGSVSSVSAMWGSGASSPTTTGTVTGAYSSLFQAAGAKYGVDPQLLSLVAQRESGMNPSAVSPAGAQGLMQLMPGTARGLGVTNAFDPAQAVDGAARLLRSHLDTFGRVDLALAAYNAGPGNVRKHGGVPPFAETQGYVRWITDRYQGAA